MNIIKRDQGNLPTKLDINALRRKSGLTKSGIAARSKSACGLQMSAMFDITGSMFGHFALIREKLNECVTVIAKDVPNAEYSITAYRNHGDEKHFAEIFYHTPFERDIEKIRVFIAGIEKGGGGPDALTCMEDCLQEANRLAWRNDAPKALVIVGDMPPHGILDSVSVCPKEINYKYEIEELIKKKIQIYSVFCGEYEQVREFYRWMATESGGKFLEVKDIDLLLSLLIGIAMRQTNNLKKYMNRLKAEKQLPSRVEGMLKQLE